MSWRLLLTCGCLLLNESSAESSCMSFLHYFHSVKSNHLSEKPKLYLVVYHMSLVMRNRIFAYAKTKTQISFAVTAKLISAFVFATRIVQSLYFLNQKFQTSSHLLWLYSWFVSDLVGNPEDRFSHNVAHIMVA